MCIPKLRGARITTGQHLQNNAVLESLCLYQELAAQWADLVLAHKKTIKYKKANNITFVALLMNCLFHKHLLDQHEDQIKQRVSVIIFLPKPEHGQSKEEYNKYVHHNHASKMEDVADEAVEKQAASKDKTVFTKGRQDTSPDIVTPLENLIFVLEFLSSNDNSIQVPGMLHMLYDCQQNHHS